MKMNPRFCSAFTLIELLAVVAIIALLAAILFPVFSKARDQARKATCLSNLRQIGVAVSLYSSDCDGGYPNNDDPYLWVGKRFRWPIMPYLALGQKQGADFTNSGGATSILLCPSDTLSGDGYDATSYCYSAAFYHTPEQIAQMSIAHLRAALNTPGPGAQCATQTESDVVLPSQKILVGEYFNSHEHGAGTAIGFWGTLTSSGAAGSDRATGARNVVFADGHAGFIFASRQTRTALDDCPDMLRTTGGLTGSDLRQAEEGYRAFGVVIPLSTKSEPQK
jgi:prepilin-type N-terminal cleavage/methylation domain-containing protein/prepilin-type processing-associated H-X9-DG protein